MKQIVDPIKGHQQAIEYREINMNKKPYLMSKDGKTIPDKVKEEISESTCYDVREPVESFSGRKKLDELHKLVE